MAARVRRDIKGSDHYPVYARSYRRVSQVLLNAIAFAAVGIVLFAVLFCC